MDPLLLLALLGMSLGIALSSWFQKRQKDPRALKITKTIPYSQIQPHSIT